MFAETYTESQFKEAFVKLKDEIWKGYWSQSSRKLEQDPSLVNYFFWLSLGDRFKSIFLVSAVAGNRVILKSLPKLFSPKRVKTGNGRKASLVIPV